MHEIQSLKLEFFSYNVITKDKVLTSIFCFQIKIILKSNVWKIKLKNINISGHIYYREREVVVRDDCHI